MAKKSARSKGYRKSVKKPYLSKRDILILAGVLAAIVVAVVLFNLLYDDGSLDVVDGVAQVQGENSLLVNAGTANSPRYYKLGQLASVEGYALESAPAGVDENVREFTYVPEGESPYDEITVNATVNDADILSAATLAAYSSAEDTVCSERQSLDWDGREVLYFTYQREYAEESEDSAADAESASTDAADSDVPGAETADAEAASADESGAETADAEAANADQSGAETADAEAADSDVSDAETADAETASADESGADASDAEAADSDVSGAEAADAEAASADESAAEAADGEAASADESDADVSDAEAADGEAAAEEPEYLQVLNAYVPVGERSIIVHLHNDTSSEAEYLSTDELVATLEEILSALSFETE